MLQSDKQYPVDFDDAIEWWDCRTRKGTPERRDSIVRRLIKNYYKDIDYHIHNFVESRQGEGSEPDKYYLTVDCFKTMGMMAPGERGKQIRKYFLDCEAHLKQKLEKETRQAARKAIASFVLHKPRSWKQEFDSY